MYRVKDVMGERWLVDEASRFNIDEIVPDILAPINKIYDVILSLIHQPMKWLALLESTMRLTAH